MKFTFGSVGLMATVIGCLGSNTWRPKKMMVQAKETPSAPAVPTAREPLKRGSALVELIKKRRAERLANGSEEVQDVSNAPLRADAGLLVSKPLNRELQSTCAMYVDCVDGRVSGTSTYCSVPCGTDCCVGDYACYRTTAKICKDGSCNGDSACGYLNAGYVSSSCTDYQACAFTGDNGGSVGDIINSCTDRLSCEQLANQGGSVGDVTDSCTAANSCTAVAVGGTLGDIISSCNAVTGCQGAVTGGTLGGIFNTCNAIDACLNFAKDSNVVGALADCCNTQEECADLDSFPFQCLENFISSHSFEGCVINHNSPDDVELACTFNSTLGVPATAEIKLGTCANNGGFAMPANSIQTTDSTVVATLDVTSEISVSDKNSGTFTRDFCTRSDIFISNSTHVVSLAAEKFDVTVDFTYDNEAEFQIAQIDLVPFEASVAETAFTRTVGVTASLGDCESTSAPTEYAIGSILTICVEVTDPDAIMDRVFNVTIATPPDTILDERGNPDFLTSIEGIPGKAANISTMMLTSFFDTGDSFITLNGLARLQFTSRRALIEGRALEEEATEEFTLKIPVKQADEPDFAEEAENSANMFGVGISFMMGLFAHVFA